MDFNEIKGLSEAKRALEIAAAGGHLILPDNLEDAAEKEEIWVHPLNRDNPEGARQ